jgi:hypothetical protein
VFEHPVADFVYRTADQTENWWSVVLVGAFPFLFVGAPARWVSQVAMRRTFSPAF